MRRAAFRAVALPAVTAVLAAVTGLTIAAPVQAGTVVTFTVASGSLSITEPSATATLTGASTILPGTLVSGSLGSTAVNDTRATSTGWTLSMAETDFSTGSATIPATDSLTWLPSLATTTGTIVITNTHITAATGLALANTAAAFMSATATGANSATFSPSMQVTLPTTATAGTYTGTITQTVA